MRVRNGYRFFSSLAVRFLRARTMPNTCGHSISLAAFMHELNPFLLAFIYVINLDEWYTTLLRTGVKTISWQYLLLDSIDFFNSRCFWLLCSALVEPNRELESVGLSVILHNTYRVPHRSSSVQRCINYLSEIRRRIKLDRAFFALGVAHCITHSRALAPPLIPGFNHRVLASQ